MRTDRGADPVQLRRASAGAKDGPSVKLSIGFGPQVGKEIMAAAALPLGPQRGQIDRADDDLFAGPGIGLGQDAAVEIDDHAAAGPRERGIIARRSLPDWPPRRRRSFRRPAPVEERPPVQRGRCAPRVHVGRDPDQDLRAGQRQGTDRLGKQPVVTDRRAQAADLGLDNGKQRLVVARQVVRTGVHLPGEPGIHLAIPAQEPVRPDQAGRVEDGARPPGITSRNDPV